MLSANLHYDKRDEAKIRRVPGRNSGAFSLLGGREAETRKPEDRLHSTSHFFTPPYIPKQRWPPSESQ